MLDADIRAFFDTIDHGWMVKFVEHRIADRRIHPPDPEMAEGGSLGGRDLDGDRSGYTARGGGLAAARERVPALRVRPLGPAMAASARRRAT